MVPTKSLHLPSSTYSYIWIIAGSVYLSTYKAVRNHSSRSLDIVQHTKKSVVLTVQYIYNSIYSSNCTICSQGWGVERCWLAWGRATKSEMFPRRDLNLEAINFSSCYSHFFAIVFLKRALVANFGAFGMVGLAPIGLRLSQVVVKFSPGFNVL